MESKCRNTSLLVAYSSDPPWFVETNLGLLSSWSWDQIMKASPIFLRLLVQLVLWRHVERLGVAKTTKANATVTKTISKSMNVNPQTRCFERRSFIASRQPLVFSSKGAALILRTSGVTTCDQPSDSHANGCAPHAEPSTPSGEQNRIVLRSDSAGPSK